MRGLVCFVVLLVQLEHSSVMGYSGLGYCGKVDASRSSAAVFGRDLRRGHRTLRVAAPNGRMAGLCMNAAVSSTGDGSDSAPMVRIVGAVVEKDKKFLMVERKKRSRGYYEFPGGKVEEGETDVHALVRELKEELNVEGKVLQDQPVATGRDGPVELLCYRAEIVGEPSSTEELSVRWVEREELDRLAVPPADSAIVQALLKG